MKTLMPNETKPTRKSQFQTVIGELNCGRVVTAIDEKLMELAQHIEDIGGVGELTVKLKLSRTQHGELQIGSDVTSKLPKPKSPANLFFFDIDKQQIVRVSSGAVTFQYELIKPHEFIDLAVLSARQEIEIATNIDPLMGS
jgi:hypothetical protein